MELEQEVDRLKKQVRTSNDDHEKLVVRTDSLSKKDNGSNFFDFKKNCNEKGIPQRQINDDHHKEWIKSGNLDFLRRDKSQENQIVQK